MKKSLFYIIVLFLFSSALQAQTITLMDKPLTFGCSPEEFTKEHPAYTLKQTNNEYKDLKVYSMKYEGVNYLFDYYFKVDVAFYKDKLFNIEITERAAPEEYQKYLTDLLSQFKKTQEVSDEESGFYEMKFMKSNLEGTFSEGDLSSHFSCHDKSIYTTFYTRYPNFTWN